MTTITRLTPDPKSIAPPGPLTILPGTIQLARSPLSATSRPPRIDRSMWPPRIIAKESALKKARPRKSGDGLLAGVDEVGIDAVFGWLGTDAEQPVLRLQRHISMV